MNISNLSEGLTLKNYKSLCTILDIKPMTSTDSRKAQYKELERYCTYSKQGQKIIINDIFPVPLDKIDHRKDIDKVSNNSKYIEHVKILLLHKLYETKEQKYTITKNNLFESLGMVNPLYLDKDQFKKMILKLDKRFLNYDINHFYLRVNDRLTKILFDSLNSLHKKYIINYREVNIIVRINKEGEEQHKEANEDELRLLTSIKYNVLEDMKLNSIMQAMFKFKTEEFYKRVNKKLKDHDIHYSYKQIELIYTKEDIINVLTQMELKTNRIKLNDKVIDTINLHAKNTYDKNIQEYNQELENFIYNEKPTLGKHIESQFKGFKHRPDYLDIQLELSEYLLRID